MELFDMELERAGKLIDGAGHDRGDFSFKQTHLPPDPEDTVMFTARYEVLVTNAKSGKTLKAVGGIGLDWVSPFGRALEEGYFG